MSGPLPQSFYDRDAREVARDLLGKTLRHGEVRLRISEVEAYLGPADSAAHTSMGRTARNEPMWGPPGRLYVYLCYGLHQMVNIVTGAPEDGQAVLIRACEPIAGLEVIKARRGGKAGPVLLTGPGKVGAALAADGSFNHHPLYRRGGITLAAGAPPEAIISGPRVGIDYADEVDRLAPLRFAIADSPWVSRRRELAAFGKGPYCT